MMNNAARFHSISYAITGCTGAPTPLEQIRASLSGRIQLNAKMNSVAALAQCSPFTISPSRPIDCTSSSAGAVKSAMTPTGCFAISAYPRAADEPSQYSTPDTDASAPYVKYLQQVVLIEAQVVYDMHEARANYAAEYRPDCGRIDDVRLYALRRRPASHQIDRTGKRQ